VVSTQSTTRYDNGIFFFFFFLEGGITSQTGAGGVRRRHTAERLRGGERGRHTVCGLLGGRMAGAGEPPGPATDPPGPARCKGRGREVQIKGGTLYANSVRGNGRSEGRGGATGRLRRQAAGWWIERERSARDAEERRVRDVRRGRRDRHRAGWRVRAGRPVQCPGRNGLRGAWGSH
jgi:hypothetical protein